MGECREEVKGTPKAKPNRSSKLGGNLNDRLGEMIDELSDLIVTKDAETLSEPASEKAENTRKAGLLRAVSASLRAAKRNLEDY